MTSIITSLDERSLRCIVVGGFGEILDEVGLTGTPSYTAIMDARTDYILDGGDEALHRVIAALTEALARSGNRRQTIALVRLIVHACAHVEEKDYPFEEHQGA